MALLPEFAGRIVMLGFGSVGQGVLPLLLGDLKLRPQQLMIVQPREAGFDAARAVGVSCVVQGVDDKNMDALLAPRLAAGDVLLNLSVDVSSVALIAWCQAHGVLYLDTCIEPWAGGYTLPGASNSARSNHALRQAALALRQPGPAPTAALTHGANPGLVSHFVKQALLDLAGDPPPPASRLGWAALAQQLGLRAIHIAERDTQIGSSRKSIGEFVNTWSCEAFVDEATQPAELGWGTHETSFPRDGERHAEAGAPGIVLARPGAATRVRSWTPIGGPMHAFVVTHAESLSIADHLTLGDPAAPAYRPTVHYAYHPCDDALLSLHELAAHEWQMQPNQRLLREDITSGRDELGVLLMGSFGAYWYGSMLSCAEARRLAVANSATTLQVAAGVLAGLAWVLRHPERGIVEPDEMDFAEVLAVARPYLGPMMGVYTDWTPLEDRGWLFAEAVDRSDPWQFGNLRVD